MADLEGRVALVTGAARGIGRAIAEALARHGARVALADLDTQRLDEAVSAVQGHGAPALAVATDVTRAGDVKRMVEQVTTRWGAIHMLFSNAGIIEVQPFLDADEAAWDRIMAVNAKGVFLCGQAVAREMVGRGEGGRIVNTASMAARVGIADMAAYAASKAAVMSLTRSMALALAPHRINVNALAPGIVDTDMWAQIDAQRAQIGGVPRGEPIRQRVAAIPLARAATPVDVAGVALFLVSEQAAYITGQTWNVDGGMLPS